MKANWRAISKRCMRAFRRTDIGPCRFGEPTSPRPMGRRPLGIPALEDKIVQGAVAEVLNAIYEADFLDCSHGFRAARSPCQPTSDTTPSYCLTGGCYRICGVAGGAGRPRSPREGPARTAQCLHELRWVKPPAALQRLEPPMYSECRH